MAGDWFKVQHSTPDKPEVLKMALVLGVEPEQVVGHLLRVWAWADQQSLNGHDVNVTEKDIDRVARHAGVAKVMREVGWLSGKDGHLAFPNFERHNGESAKKRALAAERKRAERSRNVVEKSRIESDEAVTREEDIKQNQEGCVPTEPVTEKSPVQRDDSVTPQGALTEPSVSPPLNGTDLHASAFDEFWNLWPSNNRKGAKGACERAWAAKHLEPESGTILAHVEAMKATPDWRKEGGAFVPAPLVYLNQRRWEGAEVKGGAAERKLAI